TAAVHLPRDLRRERQPRLLVDRQRVHVGADADRRPGLAAIDQRDDAGLANGLTKRNAELLEKARDCLGGLVLLERELRVFMQLATQRDQLGGKLLDTRGD